MPKEIAGQRVYTLDEVARESGIPETTLRLYAREGRIRSKKIGKAWHITEEALKEFLLGDTAGVATEAKQTGIDQSLSMIEPFTGLQQAGQEPGQGPSRSSQAGLPSSSGGRTLCHIDGVRVVITHVKGMAYLELASAQAERLYGLLRRGPVRLESTNGVQAEVANPLAQGKLRREGAQWIFQLTVGPVNELNPQASLLIAGRLIRLVR